MNNSYWNTVWPNDVVFLYNCDPTKNKDATVIKKMTTKEAKKILAELRKEDDENGR